MEIVLAAVTFVLFLTAWLLMPQWFKEELLEGIGSQFDRTISKLIIPSTHRRVIFKEGTFMTRSKKTGIIDQYKNKTGVVFKKGDTVWLTTKAFIVHDPQPPVRLMNGKRITKGVITDLFPDVDGLVIVEPRLGGFHSWDVNDLQKSK